MMSVLARSETEPFGLRPMNPMQDLAGVANLIEEAFANDLDQSGRTALRELRVLSQLKPLLWWMLLFSGDHTDFLSGFVWEEDNTIVGNITVNRASTGAQQWLISNVAVSRAYRGQGIARSLMYAALELVREYNGATVALQVRADNTPARHLYESLGFKQITGLAYLRLRRTYRPKLMPLPPGIIFRSRSFNAMDARLAYNLARIATPAAAQQEWPLRQSSFRLGNHEYVNSFVAQIIGSGPSTYWVVEHDGDFIAMVNTHPGYWRRANRIELLVHPEWRGQLEKPLISRALRYLGRWNQRSVTVKQAANHAEAVTTYRDFGFDEEQTLLWMKRTL